MSEQSQLGGGAHISFAAEVKNELAGLTAARRCCQLSELQGIFYSTRGRMVRHVDEPAAYFPLLRNPVARKVVRLARLFGRMEAKYQAVRSAKHMAFTVELPLPPDLEAAFEQPVLRAVPAAACDRKALLRGFFLGCGSVNAPSSRYHLELVAPTRSWAAAIARVLEHQGVGAGIAERGGQPVVYVKDGDGIARALSSMGASRAVMEFEKSRVVRELSGQVNRRLNFETANIDKSVGSALRQVAAIEQLEQAGRLEELPPALLEIARARRAHPDLNLSELGRRLRLSKSAVNHRLRRLVDSAVGAPGEAPRRQASRPHR